jgi:lipoate-protein ligase B
LSYFNLIIACEGEPVTSMREILGRELSLREVEERIAARFMEVFEMRAEDEAMTAAFAHNVQTTLS